MISIRERAVSCLGITGPFSVRSGLFGYIWGPMKNRRLSVRNHLALIKDKAFNLSLILVAHEPDFSGEFTRAETLRLQTAVEIMRGIYAQVGIGIRKLYWQYIPSSDAGGYSVVDRSEATDLTEDWSGANDGIDVFFVTTITDADGWSKTRGPCDKDALCGRNGAVVELLSTAQSTGVVLAHEVGHYLGLSHGNDISNVMGTDTDGDGIGETNANSTGMTPSQGDTVETHCSIRTACG